MILIPDRLSTLPDVEQEVFGEEFEVLAPCATHTSQILDEVWSRAEAVLAWHDLQFTDEVLGKLRRCKVIVRVGVGFDNVDLEAAGRRMIPVYNIPDYGTNEVADHAIGLMLAFTRGLYAYSEKFRLNSAAWQWDTAGELKRIEGSILGIVGLGRIGTATALRAKALGMKVKFYDPYVSDGMDKALGVHRVDTLDDLAGQADVVSFHTPLTEETKGMADVSFFNHLKSGAILINTSRGQVIQLDALHEALRAYKLRAAGLDVVEMEPPDPNHPLIRAWRNREGWIAYRLMITPHAAFFCEEAYREMRCKAALTAKRVLAGECPRNCVNQEWLKLSPS